MKSLFKILASAVLIASLGTQVHAAPITWGNTATSWSAGSSWVGGAAPVDNLTTDTAVFNNTTFTFQPNTGTTRSVAGITVGDTATTTGALTFTNTAFTIGSGGVTVTGNGLTAIGQVNLNAVKLGASQTWTNNAYSSTSSAAALRAGTISSGVAGNVELTLTGSGSSAGTSSAMDLTGVISNGSGTVSIVSANTGTGAIVMSGANTFSGGVTVKSGTLTIGTTGSNVQTSAGSGAITLGDSTGSADATLRKGTNIINNAITVASGSTGLATIQNGGNAFTVFGGAVTLNKDLTVKVESTSGFASMAGGFTGTGNLSLKNSVNSTGGGVNLILGDVNMVGSLINNGTFTAAVGGAAHTISSVIGTNVTGVTQNSAMGLILLGTNTYSGDTILTAGKLTIANVASTSGISGTTALTDILTVTSTAGLYAGQSITGTGIAAGTYIASINSSNNQIIMNKVGTAAGAQTDIAFGALAGSIANSALDTTGAGTLTLTGITTPTFGGLKNSGAARDLASVFTATTGGYSGVTSLTLNPGPEKSYSYSGNITNGAAGMTLTKTGDGTQTLSGNNTYTGATTISAGTLQFAKTSSLYNGTTGNWTAANIKVASGGTLALNVGGTNEFSTGNVTTILGNLGGANGTSTNGFAAGSAIAFDTTNASGNTFTVADTIANSTGSGGGALGVTKLGANTLVLTGNNTYTGTTNVTAGTLLVNGNQISATGNVTVASGATLGGNGTLGGATTISGILSPGNGTIDTLNIANNVTWQGASSNGTSTDWIFQLGVGNTSDLLNITGDFNKGSGSVFRFDFGGSTNTGTFKLVDWTGSSSFSSGNFSFTNLGSGLTGSFTMNGTQLDFQAMSAIPEASTWIAMAALAISGICLQFLKKSRSHTLTSMLSMDATKHGSKMHKNIPETEISSSLLKS